MSLWIYDFKQLLNVKNIFISHRSSIEQLFNFITYVIFGLTYYLKKIKNKKWSNFLIFSLVIVVFTGIFFTYNKSKTEFIDGIEVPSLDSNYKFDLNID